ncbi:MAG: hypothetical protein QOG95_5234 [Mycobacterium sp.]|jgi:hypothetical protein|nr:hypothetical protein [Mycobacterium sp.]
MTPSAEVQLLTFDDAPKEVFTRWDITEHQVNQHLLNESRFTTYALKNAARRASGGH